MTADAYTVAEVCRALREDSHPASGWVVWGGTGETLEPREVWLADACMWVRESGRYVSGWPAETYIATRFRWLSAWRIRRAVRRWSGKRP